MMQINTARSYVTLTRRDDDFFFSPDGMTLVPRADIEIDQRCPDHWKTIIAEAMRKGWLRPRSHMRDTEYTMEILRK